MLSIFNAAQVIGFYGFNSWVPTLLIARGINVTHSLEYSFIIAIAQPFGPALGSLFVDALERKTLIIGGLLTMGVAMLAFSMLSSPVALVIVGVLFALAGNIVSFTYHSYQAELYPTRIRARAVGFVYSWSRLAAAFGGLAVGYFLHKGGVPMVASFIGTAMLVGIVVVAAFGPRTKGLALEQINCAK
jgi:putative MFS transporter